MSQEWIIVIVITTAIVALFAYGVITEHQNKKKYRARLKAAYGKMPEARLHGFEGEADGIVRSFQEAEIDDITSSDLDLDLVFTRMNYCTSGIGREYLYYKLRNPSLHQGREERFDAQVVHFMEHEEDRLRLGMRYASLSSRSRHSFFDFLGYLDRLANKSILPYIFKDLLVFGSIFLMFVSFEIGLFSFILMMTVSIVWYLSEKKNIEPYITNMSLILHLLKTSAVIDLKSYGVFDEEDEKVRLILSKLKMFRRYARLYFSGQNGGSPLDVVADYFRMLSHSDIILFRLMLGEIKNRKEELKELAMVLGYGESVLSTAYFRASMPSWCRPAYGEDSCIHAEKAYHLLLDDPVSNSFTEDRSMLITGSNASGKSTFLKTIAICQILGEAFYTVPAESFETGRYSVYTSMALKDSITAGESYYMAEIRSLKRILDAACEGKKVLCFIDEVLRGTNTVERISASTEVLKYLKTRDVKAFAATHDIELTELLKEDYSNYHFEEYITSEDVRFDYVLKEGKSTGRNAIALLKLLGYPQDVTDHAFERAERFVNEGVWKA